MLWVEYIARYLGALPLAQLEEVLMAYQEQGEIPVARVGNKWIFEKWTFVEVIGDTRMCESVENPVYARFEHA
jgi:hypothetical protein